MILDTCSILLHIQTYTLTFITAGDKEPRWLQTIFQDLHIPKRRIIFSLDNTRGTATATYTYEKKIGIYFSVIVLVLN